MSTERRYALIGHTHDGLGGTWGSITGTLSAQTDLQSALDGKLSLSGGTITGDLVVSGRLQTDVNGLNVLGGKQIAFLRADNLAWSLVTYSAAGISVNGTDVSLAGHTHSAADIASGTLSISRLPTGNTGDWWNKVVTVAVDGVTEVGKYLDFHTTADGSDGSNDFGVRLTATMWGLGCTGDFSAASVSTTNHITNNVLTLRGDSVEQHTYDSDSAAVVFNYYGYAQGFTRFRDVNIYDGKGSQFAQFDGSARTLSVNGAVYSTGNNATLWFDSRNGSGLNWAWYADDQNYARLYRSGAGDMLIVGADGTAYAAAFTENGTPIVNKYLGINSQAASATQLATHTGSASNSLQYWQLSGNSTLNPDTNWWFGLRMGHGDADTYYNVTIVADFFADRIAFRRKAGGVDQTWRYLWHEGNFNPSSYLPLTGGTLTGNLTANNLTSVYNITLGSGYGIYLDGGSSVYIRDRSSNTYGSVAINGSKNSWAGVFFQSSYDSNGMMVSCYDNGWGLYSESGGWKTYYNGTQWFVQGQTKAVPYCDWGGGGKMSASTSAPTGGSNGDIHFQYT